MTEQYPTVVLVHGAFADSASWNGVIERLQQRGVAAIAAANPLRNLAGDASYLRDVISSVRGPVVLVGHSYAGMVITEAAAENARVAALVYVNAFVPETGDSALSLSASAPGSTLGEALAAHPLTTGGDEYVIRTESFRRQFAADVPEAVTALMAATQRPVTRAALADALLTERPAWRHIPSWHVVSDRDLNIPVVVLRAGAERASSRGTTEITGASHATPVSQPAAVAAAIAEATDAVVAARAARIGV
jgi:pimeloyl-ACP methyl ester carboxylesterase